MADELRRPKKFILMNHFIVIIESGEEKGGKNKRSRKTKFHIASASLKVQGVCWSFIHVTYVGARHPPFEV